MKQRILSLLLALCLLAAVPMAGFAAEESDTDAVQGVPTLGRPAGLTLTEDGSILVTDTLNNVIWLVSNDDISLFAGTIAPKDSYGASIGALVDDDADKAYFSQPWAIVPFLDGYAVSDRGNGAIRYLADGKVQTILLTEDFEQLSSIVGLAADPDDNLYFSDLLEGNLWKLTSDGTLSLYAEGLNEPMGLCWSSDTLYVAETGLNRISAVVNGKVTAICGSGEDGFRDGGAMSARFSAPQTVTVTADGTFYIADTGNGAVRCLRNGVVTTLLNSNDELWGVSPCALLLVGDMVFGADNYTGGLFYFYPEETAAFADVDANAWYAKEVNAAAQLGLMQGTGAGFEPNGSLTRAQLAQILMNTASVLDRDLIFAGTADFQDVQESDWFAPAVGWAQTAGLVNGKTAQLFDPKGTATRQELAVMLYRLAGTESVSTSALDGFKDADRIDDWARDAMCWAVEQGLLRGDSGYLSPTGTVTRAQTAAILVRLCTK